MIRFCDKEVACVEYESLNRKELVSYFSSGHIDDIVVVYDSFATMEYVGKITYRSLLSAINMNSAIQSEYVVLNKNIWTNTREYFDKKGGIGSIIPVLDEGYHLVCFAYMDDEANREIRMLRELSEHPEALQFKDLYSEYQCVKIYEFNELAYFFAEYLRSQNVAVQVEGVMWQNFVVGDDCEVPDYACLSIYAEGVAEKKQDLLGNILRSVSVEFECIDQIYEMNIKKGVFQNTDEEWEGLAERLRSEKVVIIGTDIEAQRAYGFLSKNGIDICCFMGGQCHKMFGKEILGRSEIQNIYKSAVYINCKSKGSAWGIGDVDYYDYVGCERNKRFILLKDYVEVPDDSIIDALRNRRIGLIGDLYLCRRLSQYLEQNEINVVECLGKTPQEELFQTMLERGGADQEDKDMTWLLVAPVIYDRDTTWKKENGQIITYCREKGIDDYTDSFSYIETYMDVESRNVAIRECLRPKRIVIGSIDSMSGNVFFRGLLDGHPSVLMFNEYQVGLNNNLFWICVSLSTESAQNILPLFWSVYKATAENIVYNKEKFNMKMEQMLMSGDRFTSQELFVMFHIAYMYMNGKNIIESDVNKMIIYWEPHWTPRKFVDDFAKWLGGKDSNLSCCVLHIARNQCMRMGSKVKRMVLKKRACTKASVLEFRFVDEKCYDGVDMLTVRFEDLKCNSKETLSSICEKWDIPWADSLMKTTKHGEKLSVNNGERAVSDFDLGPVYDVYEKYFSAFDRLRIMIFSAPFQKRNGYPYVELAQFSRRELQEMFLKQFRYESLMELDEELAIQKAIRTSLQEIRMYELFW